MTVINNIIAFNLILILVMYHDHVSKTKEYQKLVIATDNLWGEIKYSVNVALRKMWGKIYQMQSFLTI